MSRIPQGIKKNIRPEDVISKKLSLDPCGMGTWVIGLFFELIQYGKIQGNEKSGVLKRGQNVWTFF